MMRWEKKLYKYNKAMREYRQEIWEFNIWSKNKYKPTLSESYKLISPSYLDDQA